MRVALIFIIICIVVTIFYFSGSFKKFSEELFLPDQNPQLVSYLQGDWALASNEKYIMRIKRDSLIEIYDDTVRSTNSLSYIFSGAASKYFTKDSSFDFSSLGHNNLNSYDFKLKEVGNNSHDTTVHMLVYVSRLRVDMISQGSTLNFNRVK